MTHSSKRSSALLTLAVVAATVLFLLFPARYAASVKEGIVLWAVNVLPATLPFLFLTAILTHRKLFARVARSFSPITQRAFGISGAGGCCMLLSAISGYPIGARTVLDLSNAGRLREEEKFRTAVLSTTTGPAFLVGAVGCGMLNSAAAGWIMFAAHLIGVYAVGLALRLRAHTAPQPFFMPETPSPSLAEVLSNSVLSVLCVGGAVAIFYAFGAMVADIGELLSLPQALTSALRGLLEMTSGCALAAQVPSALSLALCCFFVTFGGVCVLVQQLAFLIPAGIPTSRFIAAKFAQGVVSAVAAFLLAMLFSVY